ncbi:Crp/Fnr family transcriptional regulator [Streptomyces albidoflavus]
MTDIVEVYGYDPAAGAWQNRPVFSYLRSLGLPEYAIESLMAAARIESRQRGDVLSYGPEWIHLITLGVVKETTPHGNSRLWRRGAILGDISRVMLRKGMTDQVSSWATGPHVTFLTPGVSLSLTARTFAHLIEKEPVLALLLAQLTNDRSQRVESVYASSKADPRVRVARLFEYLVLRSRRREGVERFRWTRNGIHPVPEGAYTLTGPSQADIAEALGLGRTTVEKAIASLRAEGILNALEPGTRSNRYYEIMDFGRLKSLARSDS